MSTDATRWSARRRFRAIHLTPLRLALFAVLWGLPGAAQEIEVGGQVRPRFEYRDPTLAGGPADAFISMRTRAEVDARLERGVRAFVQVQDVRFWGEETGTLGDFAADAFDLHQGFVDIEPPGDLGFLARAGRQEITFGGHRLIGNVGWTQQARSFDAVRLATRTDAVRADLFGALLSDATSAENEENAYLFGAHAEVRSIGPGTLDLYGFFNAVDFNLGEGAANTNQLTAGARWWGQSGRVRFRGEASVQTGERLGIDVRAFMLGARVGLAFAEGAATATLWFDYLSGGDRPLDDRVRVFDTLFATNHKYYGFADLFLNIPRDTNGRGLQDLALKGSWNPHPDLRLALDVHGFWVAKSGGLSTGHLGEELDLTARWTYSPNLSFTGGLSGVFAADGFAEIERLDQDMVWTYLMLDVVF